MAHEASLLHDDILDSAETRRGTPSLSAQSGDARALVEGDHLLTAAYRVVMHTRCWDLIDLFTRVGERTVAGEKLQGASNGKILDWDTYLKILSGKTGELFGFALAIGPALVGDSRRYDYYLLGRRLGAFYQMYDDLLDYCSHANTGKPPFQDYRGKTWSWPMLALEEPSFDLPEDQLRDQLFRERTVSGRSGIREALQVFQREYTELREQLVTLLGPRNSVIDMLDDLWTKSEDAIRREEFLLKR